MHTFQLNHHKLSKDEIILIVPNSLKFENSTFELSKELMKQGFQVAMSLNWDGELTTNRYIAVVCDDMDDSKEYGIIISQKTSGEMRDVIKRVVGDYKTDVVKFKMLIEEEWGRTFFVEL